MIGKDLSKYTHIITFFVIKITSSYKVILRRLCLYIFKMFVLINHMMLKFSISHGIGKERIDQKMVISFMCLRWSQEELETSTCSRIGSAWGERILVAIMWQKDEMGYDINEAKQLPWTLEGYTVKLPWSYTSLQGIRS